VYKNLSRAKLVQNRRLAKGFDTRKIWKRCDSMIGDVDNNERKAPSRRRKSYPRRGHRPI
jgi:hypothetical protein